jgi:hypothetical protein
MRILIMLALIALTSLANAGQPEKYIDVQHDAHRGATCWILNDTAISCLPDSQLAPQTPVGAKIPTSSPAPAQQQQYDEVFQL